MLHIHLQASRINFTGIGVLWDFGCKMHVWFGIREVGMFSPCSAGSVWSFQLLKALALAFLLFLPSSILAADGPNGDDFRAETDDEIDAEALRILKALSDHLSSLSHFSYRSESAHDTVQESGIKVEFGATHRLQVSRPERLRMDSERRDGEEHTIVFNGDHIVAYSHDDNVFAKVEQPGELDEAIAFTVKELRLRTPAVSILASSFYDKAMEDVEKAYYLGVATIVGEQCDHLLFSNDYADFQLWVTRSPQPVLRRMVVSYREEFGQPQFRAQFVDWDLETDPGQQFEFSPPEDAAQVRFYVEARNSERLLEDES
jgi:hypothetical protein